MLKLKSCNLARPRNSDFAAYLPLGGDRDTSTTNCPFCPWVKRLKRALRITPKGLFSSFSLPEKERRAPKREPNNSPHQTSLADRCFWAKNSTASLQMSQAKMKPHKSLFRGRKEKEKHGTVSSHSKKGPDAVQQPLQLPLQTLGSGNATRSPVKASHSFPFKFSLLGRSRSRQNESSTSSCESELTSSTEAPKDRSAARSSFLSAFKEKRQRKKDRARRKTTSVLPHQLPSSAPRNDPAPPVTSPASTESSVGPETGARTLTKDDVRVHYVLQLAVNRPLNVSRVSVGEDCQPSSAPPRSHRHSWFEDCIPVRRRVESSPLPMRNPFASLTDSSGTLKSGDGLQSPATPVMLRGLRRLHTVLGYETSDHRGRFNFDEEQVFRDPFRPLDESIPWITTPDRTPQGPQSLHFPSNKEWTPYDSPLGAHLLRKNGRSPKIRRNVSLDFISPPKLSVRPTSLFRCELQ